MLVNGPLGGDITSADCGENGDSSNAALTHSSIHLFMLPLKVKLGIPPRISPTCSLRTRWATGVGIQSGSQDKQGGGAKPVIPGRLWDLGYSSTGEKQVSKRKRPLQ